MWQSQGWSWHDPSAPCRWRPRETRASVSDAGMRIQSAYYGFSEPFILLSTRCCLPSGGQLAPTLLCHPGYLQARELKGSSSHGGQAPRRMREISAEAG